jgi:hypothetical protein
VDINSIKSIGTCANTLSSFVIVDANGTNYHHNVLSSQDTFLCFDIGALHQTLSKADLPIPVNLIDLKSEFGLLNNIIDKQAEFSWLRLSLNEMVLATKVDTVAPDASLWLHPCLESSAKHLANQSAEVALRHANWLIQLWQKYHQAISIEQAFNRAHYSKLVSQISMQGIPVDVSAIKQVTAIEAPVARNILSYVDGGRCYCPIASFGAVTGRNTTSSSAYPLSIKSCYRKWFKPAKGRCFLHLDYHRAEIGIAAAESQDENLLDLYLNGDPYLWLANQCTPVMELKKAKRLFIAFQYGATPTQAFVRKMLLPERIIQHLYNIHQTHFKRYWSWTETVIEDACFDGCLTISDGWRVGITKNSSVLSIVNFPIQAMGALILRDVVHQLDEQNVLPIGLNHDAVLLECACEEAAELVHKTKTVMQNVSQNLLGIALKVSVDIGQSGQDLLEVLEK